MIRVAYKLQHNGLEPVIVKVPITDPEGVGWQQAKKALRQYYLDRARELRAVTEQSYFEVE